MRNYLFGILAPFIFTTFTFADAHSPICQRSWIQVQQVLRDPSARMAFENNGGIANGGVCWWHSRFQRSAIYLSTYAPEKSKPSIDEANQIIHSLAYLSDVVEIPGYSNFNEFSADFKDEIQNELNSWQIRDALENFAWLRGLMGKPRLPDSQMQSRMEQLHSQFLQDISQSHTLWFMEQMPGISSHASLVVDMSPLVDGYHLELIDSNFPDQTKIVDYHTGDEALQGPSGDFVPYEGIERDNSKIDSALARFCGANTARF